MAAPDNFEILRFPPARSILLLQGVNPGFGEGRIEVAHNRLPGQQVQRRRARAYLGVS